MGFTGTMTDLPEGQLGRAPFPAIGWVMNQPTIIHDITSKGVKAVVPEYGRVILPLSELLGDQAGRCACCCFSLAGNLSDANLAFPGFPADSQIPSQSD